MDRTILSHNKNITDLITIDDLSENDIMKIMNIYFVNGYPVRNKKTGQWELVNENLDDFDESNYNFNMFNDDEIN